MKDTPAHSTSQKGKYGEKFSFLCISWVVHRHWIIIFLNHVEEDFSNSLQQCPVIRVGCRSWQHIGPPSDHQQFSSEHCSSHHPQSPLLHLQDLWVYLFEWGCKVRMTSDLANPHVTCKASSSCPTGDMSLSASRQYFCHSHASVSLIQLIPWLNRLNKTHTQNV